MLLSFVTSLGREMPTFWTNLSTELYDVILYNPVVFIVLRK